ncbi:hypothetical protein [Actinomadura sp. K4S16]|uniref:hypothetical protein n=1 Tax=Actinomadura sp. K4S16 TaxID=1316147 RepID=UPI00190F9EB6|nr:hypothetical protein [Actinomadura sp. K4S16]
MSRPAVRRTLRTPEPPRFEIRPRGTIRLRDAVGPPAGGGTVGDADDDADGDADGCADGGADMADVMGTGAAMDVSRSSAIAMRSPPVRLAVSPN